MSMNSQTDFPRNIQILNIFEKCTHPINIEPKQSLEMGRNGYIRKIGFLIFFNWIYL